MNNEEKECLFTIENPWAVCDKCHEVICDCVDQYPIWIKLSDKLPDHEDVLVSDGYNIAIGHIFEIDSNNQNIKWWTSPDKMLNDLTHWMSLPKLPEDENNNE